MGLISLGKASGYDIHRIFADSPMGQYSSSPGSIYPALERLARRGLLKANIDPKRDKRLRKTYTLTTKGRREFSHWLAEVPSYAEICSHLPTTLLRFSFMDGNRTTRQVLAYLDGFETHLKTYLADLVSRRSAFKKMQATHAFLAIDNGIRGVRSHIAWIAAARKTLPAKN